MWINMDRNWKKKNHSNHLMVKKYGIRIATSETTSSEEWILAFAERWSVWEHQIWRMKTSHQDHCSQIVVSRRRRKTGVDVCVCVCVCVCCVCVCCVCVCVCVCVLCVCVCVVCVCVCVCVCVYYSDKCLRTHTKKPRTKENVLESFLSSWLLELLWEKNENIHVLQLNLMIWYIIKI